MKNGTEAKSQNSEHSKLILMNPLEDLLKINNSLLSLNALCWRRKMCLLSHGKQYELQLQIIL